jgi:hypothetical protein
LKIGGKLGREKFKKFLIVEKAAWAEGNFENSGQRSQLKCLTDGKRIFSSIRCTGF